MSGSPEEAPETSNTLSKFCLQYKSRIFLSLFYFFFETSFSFKMFFFPVYWQQLGLSPTQIGILRAFWGVAYSVGAVLFGQMANRWRIRRALLLMSIASTVVTPLVSLIPQRSHDKCTVQSEQSPNPGLVRRTSFLYRDKEPHHLGTQWTKSITSVTLENHSHLNIVTGLGHQHLNRVKEKEVPKHHGLQRKTNLKGPRGGMERLAYTRQPTRLSHIKPRQFSFDSLKLTPKRLPRQLPPNHGKRFFLQKSPQDINTIFIIFIFIVFIGELLSSPAFNLANSEIVEFLGENSREFGKIRLWGPIGHMIAAPTTALLVTHFHYVLCGEYQDNFAIAFIVIALMASCAFISVAQFGSQQNTEHNKMNQEEDKAPMTLIAFFAQYQNFIFILMTFLIGCFDGVVLTFGFWYTKTLDVSVATLVFGLSRMTCSIVSVVFLGSIGMCVKKTGYTGVTIFSMLLFVSWFMGMSFIKNPWFMLIFETIGYIAYVMGFTGLISYFGEVTPSNLMDTVQGKPSASYFSKKTNDRENRTKTAGVGKF